VFIFYSARGLYEAVPFYGATGVVHRPFEEGAHYVEYKAVDDAGNFARCSFYVTVKGATDRYLGVGLMKLLTRGFSFIGRQHRDISRSRLRLLYATAAVLMQP